MPEINIVNQIDRSNCLDRNIIHKSFIFWIKVIFGLVGGIFYYFLLRYLFHIGFFRVYYLFRGLLIVSILLTYLFLINGIVGFIIYQLKRKKSKLVPDDISIWRFSLRFTAIFFIVFLLSASITLYIGI